MKSHGNGKFLTSELGSFGEDSIIEETALVFHPENVHIGKNVYIGHQTILKAYFKNSMYIDDGSWIGQQCFFHSGGGIKIGKNVGIGPGVKILTSNHSEEGIAKPILHSRIEFKEVTIEDDSDIGIGAIILPGVTIGRGSQIGAGAVVTSNVPNFAVMAGVPAKLLRFREI